MRKLLAGLLSLAIAAPVLGCGPKVDCKKLKNKLHECTKDLLWALKRKEKENFDKNPDKAAIEKKLEAAVQVFRSMLDKEVYKKCKQHSGRSKDAKQIITCLKKGSCDEFASCFVQYLKPKK
jgi:hypothetical protein